MAAPSVLIADDDLIARELLVEVLSREGYRVRAASGGEEAIRLAQAEVFDLALVDLRMPDLDGLDRLNGVTIAVPPLRERGHDVPLLAHYFVQRYAAAAGKSVEGFARETLALLEAYRWPGNVRELEHVVERAVALCRSTLILPEDLPPEIRVEGAHPPELPAARMTLDELRRWYVGVVLEETGGNKVRAAEILGIDRRTLYRILERESDSNE